MEKTENRIILYHASTMEVRNPIWDYEGSKNKKDFGMGFYTCSDNEYPIKLYSDNDIVILNTYELDTSNLKVIRLENDVNWLLSVGFHRRVYSRRKNLHELRDKFRKWISDSDLVIGAISDDNLFSTVDAFLDNTITDFVALGIAQMMKYEDQYVFKSEKACSQLRFINSNRVSDDIVLKYREQKHTEKSNMDDLVLELMGKLVGMNKGKTFEMVLKELRDNGV